VQPVLSTTAAYLLFRDRLAVPQFFLWAFVAIVAGGLLSVEHPELVGTSFAAAGLNAGTGFALLCALFWGLSTVAGRGAMVEMSLGFASGMRVVVGLVCMTIILAATGKLDAAALWPPAAQAHAGQAIAFLLLLAILSGGVPLLFYFRGLALTRASTAGYFEMMQTLAAVCITWGFFDAALRPHQIAAAVVLVAAVAMVQRAQESIGQ
jgi:drug/metabolite transporter (DMT)-like permease